MAPMTVVKAAGILGRKEVKANITMRPPNPTARVSRCVCGNSRARAQSRWKKSPLDFSYPEHLG